MQQLSDNLFVHRDTCNVYIVRHGDAAVLIDFGAGDVLDALPEISIKRVSDVLMTHHHRDQGQGLAKAAALGAAIWAPHTEQDLFARVDSHWQARPVYNNYNVRQDRFSLLEPVAIAGTLADYETRRFGGQAFTVIPTPGHTPGSISLLAEVDGRLVAFTGDLIAGPGKVWSLAATQWTYNGGEGLAYTVLSALDLCERQPDVLLPSHGDPAPDVAAAVGPLVDRLAELMRLRGQNPRLFALRDTPYVPLTPAAGKPHLIRNVTGMANSYALLSDSGKALLIDFGYDFMAGIAAGADRASRRPWLYTLGALKRDFAVGKVDVVIPTHYHDDHVAGFNLLRAVEGTQVWAAEAFADILEQPAAYDLPCLWYDPIPVDRRLPTGRSFRWEEYELTLHPLPGHTRYAVAVSFEVDGLRVLATGDEYQGPSGAELNYVYQNGFEPGDYCQAAALYRSLNPDLIISGHWEPQRVTSEFFDRIEVEAEALEQLHRDLQPEAPAPGDGFVARLSPYQAEVTEGEPTRFTAEVRNPFGDTTEAEVQVVVPKGWSASSRPDGRGGQGNDKAITLVLGPYETRTVEFWVTVRGGRKIRSYDDMPVGAGLVPAPGDAGATLPAPTTNVLATGADAPVRRARIAVDVTVGGWRFGQQAEALVDVAVACTVYEDNKVR